MISESLYKEPVLKITKENFLENFDELVSIIKNSPEFMKLRDCTQIIFNNNNINDNWSIDWWGFNVFIKS